MSHFENFSGLHLGTVLGFTLGWSLISAIGIRLRGSPAQARWRRLLGAWLLACWVFANGAQLLPGRFDVASVLPLHPCDIASLVAALAILRPGRVASALLYFWGLGFSVQAILTPELSQGPAHLAFWTFWLPHANLSGAAIYALVVDRYRPGWGEARLAFAIALGYLALILPFDLLTGFNYGYVGPAMPLQPTLMDFLGPWPWRIGSLVALTAAGFALLAWPWVALAQKPRSLA